jgi:protein-tyrosine phosphatase
MFVDLKYVLANKYGGKRAFLHLLRYQAELYFYNLYRHGNLDLKCAKRLVFVCQGNICRSPYAEKLAQLHGFPTLSFGLDADPGKVADPIAQEVAEERGVSLVAHRSTHILKYVPASGDVVLYFEPAHKQALERILVDQQGIRISVVGLWRDPPIAYFHDPYGLSPDYFHVCFQRIEESVSALIRRIPAPAQSLST